VQIQVPDGVRVQGLVRVQDPLVALGLYGAIEMDSTETLVDAEGQVLATEFEVEKVRKRSNCLDRDQDCSEQNCANWMSNQVHSDQNYCNRGYLDQNCSDCC
jgi:hypothetical protein